MLGGIWGCILSELKEYTPRPPKKNSGRDFDFPPRPTLKRPKEGLRPFLWKPAWGYGDSDAKDVGTGDESPERGAYCHSEHPALRKTRSLMAW